ncbi:MAG: endonuclease III [bacterium]|nr:endonuclease III [bacterium]
MATNAPSPTELHAKLMAIYPILIATYGERPLKPPRRSAMVELIMTILSQRTTAANEKLAFERLWAHYGSWEAIRDGDVDEITRLIAPSNYAEAKAPHIKATLKRIFDERGEANIDFLEALPVEDGLSWLMSLPGVGMKTASLVLLFNFAKPIMPVDTHVHRVSQRTGLIGPKVTAEKAHVRLLELLPHDPHVLFNFHVSCLRHGQKICTWERPKCTECPIKHLCDYYHTVYAAGH